MAGKDLNPAVPAFPAVEVPYLALHKKRATHRAAPYEKPKTQNLLLKNPLLSRLVYG